MALRCSILGHAWADPEVEREREERGAEAVVTVREFRACKRCSSRDVVSERTEVKPADTADVDGDGAHADDDAGDGSLDDETTIGGGAVAGEYAAGDGAVVDDGEILESEDDRDPKEWPDPGLPDDDVEYEPRPWPETEPPDPARRESGDGRPFEAITRAETDAGRGDPVDPAEVLSEAASDQGGSDGAGDDGPDDVGDGTVDELPLEDVEVFCPDCGFVDEGPIPSLRGGDSCPNCRDSYLRERDEQTEDESRKSDPIE